MRKIIGVLLSALIAVLGLTVTAQPAQAADPKITVCNADWSWERIRVFNNDTGYSKILYHGQCASDVNDRNGHARVDVDPAGVVDIGSWTKRRLGDPWDPNLCYNTENHASDPFSGAPYPGTTYWNYQQTGCRLG